MTAFFIENLRVYALYKDFYYRTERNSIPMGEGTRPFQDAWLQRIQGSVIILICEEDQEISKERTHGRAYPGSIFRLYLTLVLLRYRAY